MFLNLNPNKGIHNGLHSEDVVVIVLQRYQESQDPLVGLLVELKGNKRRQLVLDIVYSEYAHQNLHAWNILFRLQDPIKNIYYKQNELLQFTARHTGSDSADELLVFG